MELDRIEALLKLMHEYQVGELELEEEGARVSLRLAGAQPAAMPVVHAAAVPQPGAAPAAAEVVEGELVKSPMVGTFYRASKPGSPPFAEVGDKVRPGQVLCILEAMKLMNELECEVAGVVAEVLVENAQPVQFGQPLFRIIPG